MKPHRLITIAAALMLSMAFCSCKVVRASRPVRESLRTLQPLLLRSEKVDSCLEVLLGIDTTLLTRPSDKAKYALLHAMALDKNDIDTTNLSVIEPALDYYTRWYYPRRSDKFYTWYYKARIEENAKDYDASLHSYLEAERLMGATNDLYRTRLYFGFERVYMHTYSYRRGYESAKEALHYARLSGDDYNYGVALLDCMALAARYGNKVEEGGFVSEFESKRDTFLESQTNRSPFCSLFYRYKMIHYQSDDTIEGKDSLRYYLMKYIKTSRGHDVLDCAFTSIMIGDYGLSKKLLETYQANSDDGFYSYLKSRIHAYNGEYEEAYSSIMKDYMQVNKAFLYNQDNEITNDAYIYHSELSRIKNIAIALTVLLVLLFFIALLLLKVKRRSYEYRLLNQVYSDIRDQYNVLQKYISGGADLTALSGADDIKKLEQRILSMGRILYGNSLSTIDVIKRICDLGGANVAMKGASMLCAVYCVHYYNYLKNNGLNDFEKGYCTMLLQGITVKELEYALDRKNLYNVNARIRSKIGAFGDASDLVALLRKAYKEVNSDIQ